MLRLTLLIVAAFTLVGGCGQDAAKAPVAPGKAEPTTKAPATKAPETKPAPRKLAAVASCTAETELKPGIPGSPGHLIPSKINPNGHSELAQLMRMMQAELGEVRKAVEAGKPVTISDFHHKIRCAWPTAMSDHTAEFDAMAVSYLQKIDRFNDPTAKAPAKDRLNDVIEGCLNCHSKTCQGPMIAIRPLLLP